MPVIILTNCNYRFIQATLKNLHSLNYKYLFLQLFGSDNSTKTSHIAEHAGPAFDA